MEMGETMCCFGDKKSENVVYLPPFCVRLAEVTKSLQESVPVKFRSNWFQFAGVIPKKAVSYTHLTLPTILRV